MEICIEIWKFQVDPTEEQMETCDQLARSFFNFNVTVDDFAALMQSAENYRFLYTTRAIGSFIRILKEFKMTYKCNLINSKRIKGEFLLAEHLLMF